MPLLDVIPPCSCFSNGILEFKFSSIRYGRFTNWGVKTGGFELRRGGLMMINAVGTLEKVAAAAAANHSRVVNGFENMLKSDNDDTAIPTSSNDSDPPSSSSSLGDYEEMGERERLRRMRISKANKGNTPWNKGRKHSPETIQRIKEKTRLAMRDPKVKMKLVSLGHAQSDETKVKIGVGVRIGWERRRERLHLQETCLHDWQNLIAVAAKKGLLGEDELQWESYEILSKQLQLEWVESVGERKRNPRLKGNKRAPKSAEQKRRIAEAIAAKWADPEYRNRVCSGLAKYHGSPVGAEEREKKRKKPNIEGHVQRRPSNKDASNAVSPSETKSVAATKRSIKAPSYKDPFSSHKLEMLKSIKAQREAAATDQGSEAISRARMLIAEAEKAAKALETAAGKNPLAYSSLMESKKLIAEAIAVMESIENGERDPNEEDTTETAAMEDGNGGRKSDDTESDELTTRCSNGFALQIADEGSKKEMKLVKKWVRGRLVEVEEET